MPRLLYAALIATIIVAPALALDAPQLPASAKKLSGPEIRSLYDGSKMNWTSYLDGSTGTSNYDFKTKTNSGTWQAGGKKGMFSNKIRIKGDTFCFTASKTKEVCDSVYTDGADIYEVGSKGAVSFKSQKQS
jgi:hypothetical protein